MISRRRIRLLGYRAACFVGVAIGIASSRSASGAGDRGIVTGVVEVNRPAGVMPSPILIYVVGFDEPPPAVPVVVTQRNRRDFSGGHDQEQRE